MTFYITADLKNETVDKKEVCKILKYLLKALSDVKNVHNSFLISQEYEILLIWRDFDL
jgi:hypothetical protein